MIQNKQKNLSLVFFKILTCFWCLNTSKFRHKTVGESFKLIWWFSRVFLNTAYKICRWKQKGGQKEDKEVKISKSNIWPIMLEMTDLHISSFRKPKIFTDMILSAVEFSLYTNFVRGVALNAYKLSTQLETFSNRFLANFPYRPYIWTPETGQSLEKHWRYVNFDFVSYFQKKR